MLPKLKEQKEHFSDMPSSDEDRVLGDHLAYSIGDTFIECMRRSPVDQWTAIVHALRFHGLRIVEAKNKTKCENCQNKIDPDVCFCGHPREPHKRRHRFRPKGCECKK